MVKSRIGHICSAIRSLRGLTLASILSFFWGGGGGIKANTVSTESFSGVVGKHTKLSRNILSQYYFVSCFFSSIGFGCLATRGTMVLFGGASGYPVSLDLTLLSGSHSVVLPKLFDYIATPEELNERANDVFNWISQGKIKMDSFTVLALSEAKKAHDMLEGKKTTGKLLLKP